MDIKSILLGFLMKQSMTGYELKKAFSISFSHFSGISYGSIYPALKKLEKEGLVTMELQIQDGTPNRKIYTVTDAGRTFLERAFAVLFKCRHIAVCAVLCAFCGGLGSCADTSPVKIPFPKLATVAKVKKKLLSQEEKDAAIGDLAREQENHREAAIEEIEKR